MWYLLLYLIVGFALPSAVKLLPRTAKLLSRAVKLLSCIFLLRNLNMLPSLSDFGRDSRKSALTENCLLYPFKNHLNWQFSQRIKCKAFYPILFPISARFYSIGTSKIGRKLPKYRFSPNLQPVSTL